MLRSRPVACPHSTHGDPSSCSLCKGATPRVVTVTPAGEMRIDGAPFIVDGRPRKFYVDPQLPRNVAKAVKRKHRATAAAADLDHNDDIE